MLSFQLCTMAVIASLCCLPPAPAAEALAAGAATPGILVKGTPRTVCCVGDSITLGKDGLTGGYRSVLADWLASTGYAITYVGRGDDGDPANATITSSKMQAPANHEGYGSFRIDMIHNGGTAEHRTAPPIASTLKQFKPDIVLLMIGTNDILQDYELRTINQRLEELVTAIYAADNSITLLLASIPPISNNGPDHPGNSYAERPGKEALVVAYNTAVQELVTTQQAHGHHIVFVDVHAALADGGLDRGGVHPDINGYHKLAAAWYQALTGEPAPSLPKSR